MKIFIITGGTAPERSISLKSAKNVSERLIKSGHKTKLYDIKYGYENIEKNSKEFDVLFPILHGQEGEGGKLHKFLNLLNKPIVGTRDYEGLKNGWYKIPFKKFASKNNLPTSDWRKIKTEKDIEEFGFPCVLKASHGGSSLEVQILLSNKNLDDKNTQRLLNSNFKIYVEKYIKGVEFTVGILNNKPLPVIEIIPPNGEWFSYKNKYTNTKEIPYAPSVPKNKQKQAQEIALFIHKHFNFGTYSRIDFIYADGIPYALEANTIPGLTEKSLMPKAALAAGISFKELINILIMNAK